MTPGMVYSQMVKIEVEAGGLSQVEGQLQLHNEYTVS